MTSNYTKISVSQFKQTAKTKGINWLKPSLPRKSDLVAVRESQDTLAATGKDVTSLLVGELWKAQRLVLVVSKVHITRLFCWL